MGVNRLTFMAALALAIAMIGANWAAPALARPVELASATCTGGAGSAEAAFAISAGMLDCGATRFDRRDRFVRGRTELARVGLIPPGRLVWQTDPTSFDSMLIRLDYADGTERLIDVDAQMAIRNWDANGNFWVPIQQEAAPLSAIDVVVERPRSGAVLARATLSGFEIASANNYGRTLLYVLICGVLLVPVLYDLLFFRVLRARFMIWHMVMTVGTLLYVLFNSGLILVTIPGLPAMWRYGAIYVAMSLAIIGLARFSILVLEEGSVPRRLQRTLTWSAAVNLGLALLILADFEILRMRIVEIYLLSALPLIAALVAVLVVALRRGSRTAGFLVLAYAGLIASGLALIWVSLGSYQLAETIDELLYVALVVLVLGTSAAVGDRFLVIKAERDRARMTARKLGAMANSDGLTGLLNRRAFDQNRRLRAGSALFVIDIDRFKAINDTFGHQRGDEVLRHASHVIESIVGGREDGLVYRLGGEEFAVLCEIAGEDDMAELGELMRAAVEGSSDHASDLDLPKLTISIGAVLGAGQLMHVAFADADKALYRAKQNGRNRCEIADPDLAHVH